MIDILQEMCNGIFNNQRTSGNMEYCKEGRINGAVLKGNVWLIPKDAEKPHDPRKHNTKN